MACRFMHGIHPRFHPLNPRRFRTAARAPPPPPAKKASQITADSIRAIREMQRLMSSSEGDDSLERCWNWRDADLQVIESALQSNDTAVIIGLRSNIRF